MTAARSTDQKPADHGVIDLEAVRSPGRVHARETAEREIMAPKVNGTELRKQRKTRTATLSTKVRPETMETIYRIVQSGQQMSMVDVIENAIAAYDRQLRGVK